MNKIQEQILLNQVTIISALENLRLGVQNKWVLNERIKETSKLLDNQNVKKINKALNKNEN